MKKVLKSMFAMMLALTLAFGFAPVTAEAAAADSVRIGQAGGSYTIKTTYPGIGSVNVKATVSDITVNDYASLGLRNVSFTIHYKLPASSQKKIKNNVARIYHACNGKTLYTINPVVMSNSTGKCVNSNTPGLRYASTNATNISRATYRQGRYRLWNVATSFDQTYTLSYYPSLAQGDFLLGLCGFNSSVYYGNKAYKKLEKFNNGSVAYTKTTMYKKKNKKSSLFLQF